MPVYGLNEYQRHFVTESGFRNFQWVLNGVLARSAQPNYTGSDKEHEISYPQADFLKKKGITCLISSNQYALPKHSKTLLNTHGIAYYHFEVEDYKSATPEQLRRVAEIVEFNRKKGAALIHCGFGEGRTGTMVAGWAMVAHMPNQAGANLDVLCSRANLKDNFGVETEDQARSIRRAARLVDNLPATLPFPPGLGLSGPGQPAPQPSGGSAPPFAGPSGIGMPDDLSMPSISFASSGSSDIF